MTRALLLEIKNDVVNPSVRLADLLRKCRVLAANLKSEELKSWVTSELNGYPSTDDLPDYRVLSVQSFGTFINNFRQMTGHPIPLTYFPDDWHDSMREIVTVARLSVPVAELEQLVSTTKGKTLSQPWPHDLLGLIQDRILGGYRCVEANKVISPASVVGILDTIRTRILEFVLEMEPLVVDGGSATGEVSVPREMVSQVFTTTILGDVHNFSSGDNRHATLTYTEQSIPAEVFDRLLADLSHQAHDSDQLRLLVTAVQDLKASKSAPDYKDKYLAFMAVLADHMQVYGIVAPYLPAMVGFVR